MSDKKNQKMVEFMFSGLVDELIPWSVIGSGRSIHEDPEGICLSIDSETLDEDQRDEPAYMLFPDAFQVAHRKNQENQVAEARNYNIDRQLEASILKYTTDFELTDHSILLPEAFVKRKKKERRDAVGNDKASSFMEFCFPGVCESLESTEYYWDDETMVSSWSFEESFREELEDIKPRDLVKAIEAYRFKLGGAFQTVDHLIQEGYLDESIIRSDEYEALLATLAKDGDDGERDAVAKNPNTGAIILATLAEDEDDWVRQSVAENPNTSAITLATLVDDQDWEVRNAVAKHPNTSAITLAPMSEEEDDNVRQSVAENPTWIKHLAEEAKTKTSAPTTEVGGTFMCAVCGVQCRVHENTDPERIKAQMCAEHFDKKKK